MSYVVMGTGSDLPHRTITNDDIELAAADYDRSRTGQSLHDWVMQRAGVARRHRISPGEGTSDMATRAVQRALDDAGLTADDVDLLVLGTFTSDNRLPSSISYVARDLGITAKCIQLETACTGFVDSVLVATSLMGSVGYRTAVVVVTEAMTAILDTEKFLYQSIFGDGAGAVVIQEVPGATYGIEAIRTHTDAEACEWTMAPGGGTKNPITAEVLAARSQYLQLDYKAIYHYAVERMIQGTQEVLTVLDVVVDDIDWLIPHQTGANIIDEVVEQLKLPPDRLITCLDHTGNVSGASVAIALDEARRSGRLRDGDRVVMPVVGGGMAWGALSMVWRVPDGAPASNAA